MGKRPAERRSVLQSESVPERRGLFSAEKKKEMGSIMPKEIFEVTRERFHLLDRNKYIVQGSWPKEAKVEVCLDSQKLPVKVEKLEIVSAMERFKDPDLMRGEQITMTIEMPDQLDEYRKLVIYAASEGKRTVWFSITAAELEKKRDKPQVYFEEEKVQREWCA